MIGLWFRAAVLSAVASASVRANSPARVTVFAGYCNGTLWYVPTSDEYQFRGYEPCMSHRNYGEPAPLAPAAGELIRDTALELLSDLFARSGS